jgi:hypothetical protein
MVGPNSLYPEDGDDTFFPKKLITSYKTAQCHNPEDHILHVHHCENLISLIDK